MQGSHGSSECYTIASEPGQQHYKQTGDVQPQQQQAKAPERADLYKRNHIFNGAGDLLIQYCQLLRLPPLELVLCSNELLV